VNITYYNGTDTTVAAQLASSVDVVIAVLATTSSEGSDRPNLNLPSSQVALANAVGQANKNSIALVITPGPVLLPFSATCSGVLLMFMPGQEEGNAFADVLFGTVNPSGKLPLTIPNKNNETMMAPIQYPGINNEESYSEQFLIGYRWYNTNNVIPLFPFGHGLSYTTFQYSNLKINGRTVTASITNNGTKAGAEVVQLYLGFPASAGEPPLQLKGFQKIMLNPGASQPATFTITNRDLSVWNPDTNQWVVVTGTFQVYVGSSSGDLRLNGVFNN